MSKPSDAVPPARGGLSLYANLLDPDAKSTPGTISKAPVVFKPLGETPEEASTRKPLIDPAALRFQPTKRPQLAQKPKPKTTISKSLPGDNITQQVASPQAPVSSSTRPARSTLADWTGRDEEDVNGFYDGGPKRRRGGRKNKKNKHIEERIAVQDWDDIYDPSRPNNHEEYKNSDEKIREVREWKDRLYAHRMAKKASSEKDSDEEDCRPHVASRFAPPSNYSFAPPVDSPPNASREDNAAVASPYSPEPASYLPSPPSLPPPPPPTSNNIAANSTISAAISRAPVRYNLPSAPSEIPSEAELDRALAEEPEEEEETSASADEPRSLRPGQAGFAERLMSKMGWSKGKGLGADEKGIINPLRVQIEKRKRKETNAGGGLRDSGGRGKIIGGKKSASAGEEENVGKFGSMSEVIVLRGMVDGMDLDAEFQAAGDGGIIQEIGEECGDKYGRVERVYIYRSNIAPLVFVKFTAELSALRAVNALEGRIFNGNTISARFYDTEKFEAGKYE